jgi:hypothetical protein
MTSSRVEFVNCEFAKRRTSRGQKIIVWIFIKCFPQHVVNNSSYGVIAHYQHSKPPFHYPWQFTWPHSSYQSFSHQPLRLGAWFTHLDVLVGAFHINSPCPWLHSCIPTTFYIGKYKRLDVFR